MYILMRSYFAKGAIIFIALLLLPTTKYAQCASTSNIYSFTYNGKSYEVVKEMKNWTAAAACAVSRGGYLVEINSQAEQDSVYDAIVNGASVTSNYTTVNDGGGIAYVWIGATDKNVEGTWLWDGNDDNSGQNFWTGEGSAGSGTGAAIGGLYNNWGGSTNGSANEPDDFLNNQDGGGIALSNWPFGIAKEWNDISSSNSLYYVIEYDCVQSNITDSLTICSGNSFTFPDGTIQNNITTTLSYTSSLTGALGCDSTIVTVLTPVSLDTSVTQNGTQLLSNSIGTSYQWVDCNDSFSSLNGETNQSFTIPSNGNYAVIIDNGSCSDTSACYAINNFSLNSNTGLNTIQIFPNPTHGKLSIASDHYFSVQSISLLSLDGKIVLDVSSTSLNQSIDVNNIPSGIYWLKIVSDTEVMSFKWIKQ